MINPIVDGEATVVAGLSCNCFAENEDLGLRLYDGSRLWIVRILVTSKCSDLVK